MSLGTVKAPPIACTIRDAINTPTVGEMPHSPEPTANTTTPIRNIRFRPIRSAARPAVSNAAANAMLYALKTQVSCCWRRGPKSFTIERNATLRMLVSRNTMSDPTDVVASTFRPRSMPSR